MAGVMRVGDDMKRSARSYKVQCDQPDLDYQALANLLGKVTHTKTEDSILPVIFPGRGSVGMTFKEFDRCVCLARLREYIRPAHPDEKEFGDDCEYVFVKEVLPGVRERKKAQVFFFDDWEED